MNRFCGSLVVIFVVAWLFVCGILIAVYTKAIAQSHDDHHDSISTFDGEKMAGGDLGSVPMRDPAAQPRKTDSIKAALLSNDTPTLLTGKVLDTEDRAVARTIVTLTEANGTAHTTTSDSFGNFQFKEILGGQQVVLSAEAGRHSFSDIPIGITGETTVSWRAEPK